MLNFKSINLIRVSIIVFCLFTFSNCYAVDEYKLLEPLPCNSSTSEASSGSYGCIGDELGTVDTSEEGALGKYLNLMLIVFIGLAAVLAVVMIVVGGIEYMSSELISSKEQGKSRMTNAIFGLIVALGAYALLYTINPNLLNLDFKIKPANIDIDINVDVPQTYNPTTRKYPNGATFGNPWNDSVGINATLPRYVTAKEPPCTSTGQLGCTSIRGLDVSIVQKIQYGCSCELLITGGTEFWLHGGYSGNTTHKLGSSTVDLRPNDKLNNYIAGNSPLVRMKRYEKDGISFLWEGSHWHVGP